MSDSMPPFPKTWEAWQRCARHLLPASCRSVTTTSPKHTVEDSVSARLYSKYIAQRYSEPQRHYHTMHHVEAMLVQLEEYNNLVRAASSTPAVRRQEGGEKEERRAGNVALDSSGAPQQLALELSILFHDAVYDPQAHDNEEQSVTWLKQFLHESQQLAEGRAGSSDAVLWANTEAVTALQDTTQTYILATKQHLSLPPVEWLCDEADSGVREDLPAGREDPPLHLLLDLDLAVLGCPEAVYRVYADQIRQEYSFFPDSAFCEGRLAFLNSLSAHRQLFKTRYFFHRLEQQARANTHAEHDRLQRRLRELRGE